MIENSIFLIQSFKLTRNLYTNALQTHSFKLRMFPRNNIISHASNEPFHYACGRYTTCRVNVRSSLNISAALLPPSVAHVDAIANDALDGWEGGTCVCVYAPHSAAADNEHGWLYAQQNNLHNTIQFSMVCHSMNIECAFHVFGRDAPHNYYVRNATNGT